MREWRRRWGPWLVLLGALSIACSDGERAPSLGTTGGADASPKHDAASEAGDATLPEGSTPAQETEGSLTTTNSANRTGSYFLPQGYDVQPTPLLVAWHGTGGNGAAMVNLFRALAASEGFIIVAPDSRKSPDGEWTWQVGDSPGDVTEDYTHTLGCVAEVDAMVGVSFDEQRVVAIGYSGGGSSAPYLATNETLFRNFAVLHGGVIEGGIGSNVVPGWFSTGEADTIRTPAMVQGAKDYMEGLGFDDLVFHTFPGGHAVGSQEAEAVIAWWLD